MSLSDYDDLLKAEGFEPIGSVNCDVRMTLFWHPQHRLEVALVDLRKWVLIRATKCYRLRAIGESGEEMYARDLPGFNTYLITHFGEVHLWLSHFSDITPSLARKRIREKRFRHTSGSEDITPEELEDSLGKLSAELAATEAALQRDEDLFRLDRGRSPLLQRHLRDQIDRTRRRAEQLRADAKGIGDRLTVQNHLEKEYGRKSEATCLLFAVCSNIQIVRERTEFGDAVAAVVKELQDIHRYQIQQKLQGGKLQIYCDEVDAPGVSLLSRWTGAALSPRQLARFGLKAEQLQEAMEPQFMVSPRNDILLGGSVQDEKKLAGARIVLDLLQRLDRVPESRTGPIHPPKGIMPVWIGFVPDAGSRDGRPWELPIDLMGNMFISGSTGSGKSYLGRVIVEGSAAHKDLQIVILDPSNQWVGLLCPEDRPEILSRYERFGLKRDFARSFDFTYHGIAQGLGDPLPTDLRELAKGRRIISFKGLDDRTRCTVFAGIMNALFEGCAVSESDLPKLLVLIEESHRFTQKGATRENSDSAERAERSISKCAREGRKYGMPLVFLSQCAMDFTREMVSVRQCITTRAFMHNTDREIEYAADFLDDAKAIVALPPGEAFLCNPEWGVVKLCVRPPLSKVWEPSDRETRSLLGSAARLEVRLSEIAQAMLRIAREDQNENGGPVRLDSIARRLGITSRRRILGIVKELESASLARFDRINERGQPVVIIPVSTQSG